MKNSHKTFTETKRNHFFQLCPLITKDRTPYCTVVRVNGSLCSTNVQRFSDEVLRRAEGSKDIVLSFGEKTKFDDVSVNASLIGLARNRMPYGGKVILVHNGNEHVINSLYIHKLDTEPFQGSMPAVTTLDEAIKLSKDRFYDVPRITTRPGYAPGKPWSERVYDFLSTLIPRRIL